MIETNIPTPQFEVPKRYARIDSSNEHSFYMTDADRPFDVIMSVHSAGAPRERIRKADEGDLKTHTVEEINFINERNKASRFILAGNMSTVALPDGKVPYGPSELTDFERLEDSR